MSLFGAGDVLLMHFALRTLILAAGTLPAVSLRAAAPDPAPDPVTLPMTVVTASARPAATELAREELIKVNGGVNLVTRGAAEKTPLLGLADMLRGQVGVDTSARTAIDSTAISIRGSGLNDKTGNGRGLAVIQDGAPINQADGLMDLSPIDPDALDAVEIRRGGNALRYGANALGGAIVLTSATGLTSPGVRLIATGGSYGYAKGFVSAGGETDAVDGFGAYSYARSDGYRENSRGDAHRVNVNAGTQLAAGVENRVFASFTDYFTATPGDVTRAVMQSSPTSAAPAAALYQTYRAHRLVRGADTISFFNDDTRFDLTAGAYYRDLDEHGATNVTDKVTTIGSLNGILRHDGELDGRRATSTLGFNLAAGTVDDNRFTPLPGTDTRGAKKEASDQSANTVELFGEQDYYVTRHDAVTVGAQGLWTTRTLDYTFNKPASENREKAYVGFNPKLGARHEFDRHTSVFGNISHSTEAPTFAQFKTSRAEQPTNLDAQQAWTAEIGTRGEHHRWRWEVTPYYSWVSDEFLTYSTGPAATDFTTLNADETTHRGIEWGVDVELFSELADTASIGDGRARHRLLLRNAGNLADHRFQGDALYGDNRLPGSSIYRHRVELMLELQGGFYVGPNVELATDSYVDSANTLRAPAYATLNLQTGYRWSHAGRVFLEARNLTGERYSPTLSTLANAAGADQAVFRPADGPAAYAGLELRF
jgi:iron complex outermembrane receptor protein